MNSEQSLRRRWKKELRELEQQFKEDPSNLVVASQLWRKLDSGLEDNYKSIRRAVLTFRSAALSSPKGVEALASALMEAFDLTGQPPDVDDFDDELLATIQSLSGKDGSDDNMNWLVNCLKK